MTSLDYRLFDADNHYYEAEDAFTRYLDRSLARRAVDWAEVHGRKKLLVGGAINSFIPNPTFDPIGKPGALMEYYKGTEAGGAGFRARISDTEPLSLHPEYRNRDARLTVMDEQGIEACWLFPTLGVGIEHALQGDPEAAMAAFSAFNRWLHEDWGFAYQGRIFAAPFLCLKDLAGAVSELERVLAQGARVITMCPGPVATAAGPRSPFTPAYDPFWARVNEAGVTLAIHGGASLYSDFESIWERGAQMRAFFGSPLGGIIHGTHRDIHDTLAAMICHGLFARHPRLRVASIENGANWVRGLLQKLEIAGNQHREAFREKPLDTFRRHVWVAPFWEDDPVDVAHAVGADRTLLGSDWPHLEGVAVPKSYAERLTPLGAAGARRIMRDNALELTGPCSL